MRSSGNGLAHQIAKLFRELLERELQTAKRTTEAQKRELLEKIIARETELKDDGGLDALFEKYKASLSVTERPESRVQERRLYYNWEGRLRSELGSWRMGLAELETRNNDADAILTSARNKVMRLLLRETLVEVNPGCHNGPKPNAKDAGNLEECLIPVIQHMIKGKSHSEAVRVVAEKLGVRKTTVAYQCTNGLGLTTEQFVEHVASGRIVQEVKKKYPEQIKLISRELGPLYP